MSPAGIRSRLSYANVAATVALCLALGGGAYAAATAPKNSVTSKSVKNNSLKGADVAPDTLTGADLREDSLGEVPQAASADTAGTAATADGVDQNAVTGAGVVDGSLSGADVGPNSLGGAQVDESSLELPAAPNEATPISKRQSANTGFETVFEGNGLRVEVDCSGASGSGDVRFDLLAPGVLERTALFNGVAVATGSQGGPANDAALANATTNGETDVTARWRRDSDGKVVTVEMAVITNNAAVAPVTDCVHVGTAFAE
jgi:hypothetical protein